MKFKHFDPCKNRFRTDAQTIDGALKREKTLVKWDEQGQGPETGLEDKDDRVSSLQSHFPQ